LDALVRGIGPKPLERVKATISQRWNGIVAGKIEPADQTEERVLKHVKKEMESGRIKDENDAVKEAANEHLHELLWLLSDKVCGGAPGVPASVACDEITLHASNPSLCRVQIDGESYDIKCAGSVVLVGEFTVARTLASAVRVRVYPRFIGKVFWQYCRR
jgi:hypothetical protein